MSKTKDKFKGNLKIPSVFKLNWDFPDDFFDDESSEAAFVKELKEDAIFKLYAQGKIGSGYGANLLGITREEFIKQLGPRGIDYFNISPEELEQDFRSSQKVSDRIRKNKK